MSAATPAKQQKNANQQQKVAANANPAADGANVVKEKILAERFKTQMCRNYERKGSCPYENKCMFAHGDDDMRTPEMNVRDGLFTEESIEAFRRAQRLLKKRARQAAAAAAKAAAAAAAAEEATSNTSATAAAGDATSSSAEIEREGFSPACSPAPAAQQYCSPSSSPLTTKVFTNESQRCGRPSFLAPLPPAYPGNNNNNSTNIAQQQSTPNQNNNTNMMASVASISITNNSNCTSPAMIAAIPTTPMSFSRSITGNNAYAQHCNHHNVTTMTNLSSAASSVGERLDADAFDGAESSSCHAQCHHQFGAGGKVMTVAGQTIRIGGNSFNANEYNGGNFGGGNNSISMRTTSMNSSVDLSGNSPNSASARMQQQQQYNYVASAAATRPLLSPSAASVATSRNSPVSSSYRHNPYAALSRGL